ncbi:hypothetical protein QJS04_geneDACA012055 [Acorus gramineus]|uniref:FLZ-type domain-containing protein n=1 Tax=Acorus gramineus TaxID=55184 RepID=A0AAV9BAQ2_ACOGR|nr:hypothetical protein QJS04_geneDACA012055 [Acorus gramineus]
MGSSFLGIRGGEEDLEAGFSGRISNKPSRMSRRPSFRAFQACVGSPRFRNRGCDEGPHFLDSCFLCKKPLGSNRDIFMYRGDTPFCSEECRGEQVEMDDAKEKSYALAMKQKASRREKSKVEKGEAIHVRSGTTVVAG